MAPLEITNEFERKTWNEWSQRLKVLSTYRVRKQYFPNKMDLLESIIKKFQDQQRASTKAVIERRNDLPSSTYLLSEEEREIWYNHCNDIRSKEFVAYNFDEYMDQICTMEKKRLSNLTQTTSITMRKAQEEEAIEGLMILSKVAHQEAHKKRMKEQRKKEEEEKKKEPVVLRKSVRILEKNS